MKLVIASPSPFARKVRVALIEKGLPFEEVMDEPWNATAMAPRWNPLGTIHGLAKFMLREELSDQKRRSYANSVVGISEEMLSLVENLLDVAVIESGHFRLDRTVGNLAELVRERAARAADAAAPKGIEVRTAIDGIPDSAFDAPRMGQVLDNLLSNAVKFSPPDSTIRVSCTMNDDEILVTVEDRGAGMEPDDLSTIFDPYGRSSTRPTAGEKSTGLGLSIVKHVVEAHGGWIDVDSTVGEGTVFTLAVPMADPGSGGP